MPMKCPACHARGIPLSQRVGLHRAHPMTCGVCGERFEVPMWTRLAFIALVLLSIPMTLALADALSKPVGHGILAFALGLAGTSVVLLVAIAALFTAAPIREHQG